MQELDFEALSYVWGTNSSSHEIRLNGNIKLIRNNLWSALNQLRHANRPRTLWVDDLCIDQECTEERNHQVREMGQIYGSASTVLIWLGPGGEFSELAFNFIRTMIIDAELGTGGEASRRMGIFWSAFKKLCLREYWERLWVIQE
ncbi:heterokaryon incompatibility, partial [Cadophora sp. DSE1049]